MKVIPCLCLLLATFAASYARQSGDARVQTSVARFLADASRFLAKHPVDRKHLQIQADQLAKRYRDQLRGIQGKLVWLESESGGRLNQLGWKEKANLISELWKVRASLNLMSLLSPETLKELTGIDGAVLATWITRIKAVEDKFKRSIPFLSLGSESIQLA